MRKKNNASNEGRPARTAGSGKGNFKSGGASAGSGRGYAGKKSRVKPEVESRFSKPSIKKSSLRIASEKPVNRGASADDNTFRSRSQEGRVSDRKWAGKDNSAGDRSKPSRFETPRERPFKGDFKREFKSNSSGIASYTEEGKSNVHRFSDAREGKKDRKEFPSRKPFQERIGKGLKDDRKSTSEGEGAQRRVGRFERAPRYNLDQYQENAPKGKKEKEVDEFIRLNRYIANAGICSRREADELIVSGQISVNGKTVVEMGFKVKPADTVKYGKKVLNPERMVYILINKPKDYITTTDDPEDRKKVIDLIAGACQERVYPVGRLDRNTTGLLLMTNDGELAEKLTHPSSGIKKIYQAELDRPISTEDFEKLKSGVELEDGFIRPDELGIVTPDAMVVGIEIHSGRNRIVRRMFEYLGYDVQKLDRTTFAGLNKKDLPRGKWRFLTEKEVVRLKFLI